MVATHQYSETNGTAPGVVTDGVANVNFGSTDAANIVVANFPIRAGESSFSKFIRSKFTGTFNQISAMKFWRSDGQAMPTGITITGSANATYATPTATDNGDAALPTTEGTALSIGPATITVTGSYSNYIRLQMDTTTAAAPGNTLTFTMTKQFDES